MSTVRFSISRVRTFVATKAASTAAPMKIVDIPMSTNIRCRRSGYDAEEVAQDDQEPAGHEDDQEDRLPDALEERVRAIAIS